MKKLVKSCLPGVLGTELSKLNSAIKDHRRKKYISYYTAIRNLFKYRNIKYEIYDLQRIKKFKSSDTIFVLGSGPSLNLAKQKHIEAILKCDSFGINYSYLKKEIVPTFHQFSWENNWSHKHQINTFSPYRKKYKDVVVFFHSKELFRMAHPRITPFFFPENAICCLYDLPEAIILENERPFCRNDFDKTLFYRGTLSLVLDLISKLEYKNIILLGVDLNTPEHFFYDMPEMVEYTKMQKVIHDKDKFQYMIPKQNKNIPFDEYLYELKDYLLVENSVNLFVGYKSNMLYPKIPAYFD